MENLLKYYRNYLPFHVHGKYSDDNMKIIISKLKEYSDGLFKEYTWRKLKNNEISKNKHLKQIANYFLNFQSNEEMYEALCEWKNIETTKLDYTVSPKFREGDNSIWRKNINNSNCNSNKNTIRVLRKNASKKTWKNFKKLFTEKFDKLATQYKPSFQV